MSGEILRVLLVEQEPKLLNAILFYITDITVLLYFKILISKWDLPSFFAILIHVIFAFMYVF